MPIQVKVLMIVVGVYLMGVYIFRFVIALIDGELDNHDKEVSSLWPLALLIWLLDWLFERIVRVWPKISRPFKMPMHYLSICFYWAFLPFRPAELGKVLHRLLVNHR